MNKNIAVGFIIFHEDEDFYSKLELLLNNNIPVFLYDNSPNKIRSKDFLKLRNDSFCYLTSGGNAGLGVGLTSLSSKAFNKEYDHLLFFDQDTKFSIETINFTMQLAQSEFYKKYAAVSFSEMNFFSASNSELSLINPLCSVKETVLIRNSGTLFNLQDLKKINWFNKDFFVEGVDYEFCLRCLNHKLKLALINNVPGFDHESDQGNANYKIFGLNLIGRKYPKQRIREVCLSSIQLIYLGLRNFKILFVLFILRNNGLFLIKQMLLRIAKLN